MKKLAITDLEPGHVVARPVTTTTGMVMMQPGAVLTAELIDRLVNLGIDAVWLEGASPDAKPLDVQLRELEGRFSGHQGDPLMMDLKAIVARLIRSEQAVSHD